MSDARSQRADKTRQDIEKQQVTLQLQQQQLRAEAEAAAASEGGEEGAERKHLQASAVPEERNLVVIIKADVQVSLLLMMDACLSQAL